jgi:hypothetical protein
MDDANIIYFAVWMRRCLCGTWCVLILLDDIYSHKPAGNQDNRPLDGSITRPPSRPTASPSIDGTDPRACFSSYISFAVADISESVYFWVNLTSQAISKTAEPRYGTQFSIVTAGGVAKECDGISRVQYVSTTTKTTFREWETADVYRNGSLPTGVLQRLVKTESFLLPRSELEPYPSCSIPRESCSEHWKVFNSAVRSFSTVPELGLPTENDTIVQRFRWEWGINMLGSCPQPELECRSGDWTTDMEHKTKLARNLGEPLGPEGMFQCFLAIDRFVLIHFPPTYTSRNICAANGYGTEMSITHLDKNEAPMTAVLNAITFSANHPELCFMGHQQDFRQTTCK